MSRPKGAVKWGNGNVTSSKEDDRRHVSADLSGNREQRRAAKRLGLTAPSKPGADGDEQ